MRLKYSLLSILFMVLLGCGENPQNKTKSVQSKVTKKVEITPERLKKSNIYEVNIRQYTPEGTFKAFEEHLPRLKKMGVDILWIMPIYPISEKGRKGTKGSYYAVQNYKKVNPEFGTEADFKHLVEKAHQMGMLLILDWVANHTGWDNPWITEHPDWYTQDSTGNIISPVPDWTDVADLNYKNKKMRSAMIDALKFWIQNYDIDGYRCDVAGMVPTDFWNNARTELNKVKSIFMLAEGEQTDLQETAFDMGYAWSLLHIMDNVAAGKSNADSLRKHFTKIQKEYPKTALHMGFTTNHDENSWNGTVYERMKNESYKTFAILTFTAPCMPLIYSGQEAGLNKRLKFFDKDTINWENLNLEEFYSKLIALKNENEALYNGTKTGSITFPKTTNPEKVFTFLRETANNKVLIILNLSNSQTSVNIENISLKEDFTDKLSGKKFNLKQDLPLKPWEFHVFVIK